MNNRDVEVMRIRLASTTDPKESYTIEVRRNPDRVSCNCKSGRIRGYCKHIKFYKQLIAAYLHESPDFEKEKGGK